MAGVAILIILHDILSMPVALLLDNPPNIIIYKYYLQILFTYYRQILFTVVGWNAVNSDVTFFTYVSKLQFDVSI